MYGLIARSMSGRQVGLAMEPRQVDGVLVDVATLSGGAGSSGLAAGLSVWASIGNEVDILLRVTETSEFTRFSPSDVLHDFEMLVGLGLTAFGKLNPARSFASLNVGVCLGRQR